MTVTTREPERLNIAGAEVIRVDEVAARVCRGVMVLHSIPPNGPADLLSALGRAPERVVYLSSTAIYGSAGFVNEHTPVDLSSERVRARVEAEREVMAGPWSSLVLRPAAIYGPGRGIQESMRRGAYTLSDLYVSRIHVDDLAAHAEAGLLSTVTGAYPVADEEPCTSREMAEFCAGLLGVELGPGHDAPSRFSSNRRVDGSAIRKLLGIELRYPSYRVGVPASLRMAG